MIYDYECWRCDHTAERICKVDERNDTFTCQKCGEVMERIPSFGGGLKTEHPSWLDDHVRGAIQVPEARQKITTRTEHDNYCKERGIAHR